MTNQKVLISKCQMKNVSVCLVNDLSATDMQTNVCQIDMQSRINVTDVRETSKLLLICQLRPQYIMVKLWSVKQQHHSDVKHRCQQFVVLLNII